MKLNLKSLMDFDRFKKLWEDSKAHRWNCERDWDRAGNTFAKWFLIGMAAWFVIVGLHGWFLFLVFNIKPIIEVGLPIWIAVPRVIGMMAVLIGVIGGMIWLIACGPPIACSLRKAWKKDRVE